MNEEGFSKEFMDAWFLGELGIKEEEKDEVFRLLAIILAKIKYCSSKLKNGWYISQSRSMLRNDLWFLAYASGKPITSKEAIRYFDALNNLGYIGIFPNPDDNARQLICITQEGEAFCKEVLGFEKNIFEVCKSQQSRDDQNL